MTQSIHDLRTIDPLPRHYLLTGTMHAGIITDAYYLDGRTYADSCVCGEPTAPGLVWCHPCAARVERLHAFAKTFSGE